MGSQVTVKNSQFEISAYFVVPPNSTTSGIILIHEVWGLNDNIRHTAERLAAEGYVILAPDLISQTGITEQIDQTIMAEIANPATREEAQKKMREAMTPLQQPEYGRQTMEKLQACFNFLKNEKKLQKVAVVGFCFGGTYSYVFAAAQPQLAAAVPFYGHGLQSEDDYNKIACPVLSFYGGKDERLMQQLPQLAQGMRKAGKDFQYKIYPEAGHAFFNETNPATYQQGAAEDSWKRMLEFFKEHQI